MQMGYAGTAPMGATRSYEFNDAENSTIASTAKFARFWGIISIVLGVLVLIAGGLIGAMAGSLGSSLGGKGAMLGAVGFALLPTAVVYLVGGIFYLQSGSSLQGVVETQGNDIALLMSAVKSLGRAFMIEAIASMVAFVVGLGIGFANVASGGH